jgi:hypothetical protein
MENGNETYVASVTSPATDPESIVKDVTEKLYGEPQLTIRELIEYVIKDDGSFSEDDKNIMNAIKHSLNLVDNSQNKPDPEKQILAIKASDQNGEYKSFINSKGETSSVIEPNGIAKDYFEPTSIDGKNYKGLELEVNHQPKGASGLDHILMKQYETPRTEVRGITLSKSS